MRRFLRLGLIVFLLLPFGLSGCGKKGSLEPPPGATEDERVKREWGG